MSFAEQPGSLSKKSGRKRQNRPKDLRVAPIVLDHAGGSRSKNVEPSGASASANPFDNTVEQIRRFDPAADNEGQGDEDQDYDNDEEQAQDEDGPLDRLSEGGEITFATNKGDNELGFTPSGRLEFAKKFIDATSTKTSGLQCVSCLKDPTLSYDKKKKGGVLPREARSTPKGKPSLQREAYHAWFPHRRSWHAAEGNLPALQEVFRRQGVLWSCHYRASHF